MKLSEHFTLEELIASETAARLNIDNTPGPGELLNIRTYLVPGAEKARGFLGHPMLISSGFRSKLLNTKVPGSSDTSAHTLGFAIDFTCPGFGSPWDVCIALVEKSGIKFDQIIYESALNRYGKLTVWVHLSFDPRLRQLVTTKLPGQPYRAGLHQS